MPFFLQPEKHYVGAAWYQRDMEIPAAWQGKRVVLDAWSAPHWETRVWLDGRELGTNTASRRRTSMTSAPACPGQAHADHPRG